MLIIWILFILWLIISLASCNNTIPIYSISTTATSFSGPDSNYSGPFAQSIIPGIKIAFNEINMRTDILPNFTLKAIQTEDCGNDKLIALNNCIDIARKSLINKTPNTIISPIVLAAPWSEFSEVTSTTFGKFNYFQISSTAQSTSLSEISSFYRVITNTKLFANAYIEVCKHFEWDRIGIVYIDDTYGRNVKYHIKEAAEASNISVKTHSFSYSTNAQTLAASMKDITEFIKHNKLFITIIVTGIGGVEPIMGALQENDMLTYPYYYLFKSNPSQLENANSINLQGFLTIMPMHISLLSREQFIDFNVYDGNTSLYDISNKKYSNIKHGWSELYNTDPSIVYNQREPHDYVAWGYDAAYTAAYTLNNLVERGFDLYNIDYDNTSVIDAMEDYMKNSLYFIGASGIVEMDKMGDIMHGYYLYGYIGSGNSFIPFGAYTDNDHITIDDTVQFPDYFGSTIPLSKEVIDVKIITVDKNWYWAVNGLCIIFIVLTVICIGLIWKEREHETIKKSSYVLSILTCFGSILGFVHLMLQRSGDFGCITTSYGRGLLITLIFMPVFGRLYRLHHIINKQNQRKKDVDYVTLIHKFQIKLHIGIFAMGAIDVLLFTIVLISHFKFGTIKSFGFIDGDKTQSSSNVALFNQNKYQICREDRERAAIVFAAIFITYKCIQFLFGLYFAFTIFRNKWAYLKKNNDEISVVLLSVVISVVMMFILITYSTAASNTDNLQLTYCIYSFFGIAIIMIMMIGNVLPRLWIRYITEGSHKFGQTPEEMIIYHIEFHTATSTSEVGTHPTKTDTPVGTNTHEDSDAIDVGLVGIDENGEEKQEEEE